ncbi:unnamed protein product [Protopolystoma xenopodis]|uniref:Uncharacterized protein n=1 Tax=Protopolystoma xenopodis TaxID=117903 RepID=A0A3S5FE57_9PLAT|nr:unnamed protein product [Protopolystoma xenopodis]
MARLADDADYDAGETSEDVSSPLSDAGNQDNYADDFGLGAFYIVALATRPSCDNEETRCVLHSLPEHKTKLRQRGQPTSIGY